MVFPYPNTETAGMGCAATVIGTRFAITAAHCLVGDEGFEAPFNADIDGSTYQVVETRVNNCYDSDDETPNSADVGILVFGSDITGTPYEVYEAATDGSEVS